MSNIATPNRRPRDPGLAFGVIAGLAPDFPADLAREVEALGYGGFWINDGGRPDADGLAGLAVVAAAAPTLSLGVGVLPLDRRRAEDVAAEVSERGLPLERLRLGVGSGGAVERPLHVVREGIAGLRDRLPDARLYVSALGPQMSRLAGELADGVLFNWAVPERLAAVSALVAEGARIAGREQGERWAYVRSAVGTDARRRVGEEAARYAQSPAYGRAFEAMGMPLAEIGVAGEELAVQLRPYRAVLDGVVVRALPVTWTLDDVVGIARAAVGDGGPSRD